MNQLISIFKARRCLQFIWIAVSVCAFWEYSYTLYLAFILFALALSYRMFISSRKKIVFRAVDICILLVLSVEIINYAFSCYPPNTFLFLSRLCIAVVLYAGYSLITNPGDDDRLRLYIAAYGSSIGLLNLFSFFLFRREVIQNGFSDLANLKYLYAPLGHQPNDWSAVLLIFLAFSIYIHLTRTADGAKKYKWVTSGIILLVLSIYVTFSKGIYLACFFFLLITATILILKKVLHLKDVLKQLGIVGLLLITFITILSGFKFQDPNTQQSVSGSRSAAGRLLIWESSKKMFTDHPFTGIGSSNFPLYYPAYENKSVNAVYTTRVNNTFVQLLVEKGVVGFLSYTVLFVSIFYALARRLKKQDSSRRQIVFTAVMIGLCCALAVKECTFSSLFEDNALLTMFFLVCALIRRESGIIITFEPSNRLQQASVAFPILLLAWMSFQFNLVCNANEQNNNAVIARYNGDFNKAIHCIDKAIADCPDQAIYYIHRATLLEYQYRQTYLNSSDSAIFPVNYKLKYTTSVSNAIIADYQQALKINDMDARAHQNIAWQYLYVDSTGKACYHLEKAIALDPSEALSWLSLALVLEISGQEKKADGFYVEALVRSPVIINGLFWRQFESTYPERSALLLAESEKRLEVLSNSDIIAKAKYAVFLKNRGDQHAVPMLEEVNSRLPNLSRVSLNLGQFYLKTGEVNKGISHIRRTILLDRHDFIAMLTLAGYLEKSREYEKSISYYTKALQLQLNAKSTYDERVARTYETRATLQTCMPGKLWQDVNFQLLSTDICLKLAELYHLSNDEVSSKYYMKLSKKMFNLI